MVVVALESQSEEEAYLVLIVGNLRAREIATKHSVSPSRQYSIFFTVRSSSDLWRFPYDEAGAIRLFGRITADTYDVLSKRSGIPIVLVDNTLCLCVFFENW